MLSIVQYFTLKIYFKFFSQNGSFLFHPTIKNICLLDFTGQFSEKHFCLAHASLLLKPEMPDLFIKINTYKKRLPKLK